MTIVIACNQEYYTKAKIYFDSLKKNWTDRVCILCIDFDPPKKYDGFEYATCEAESLSSYRLGWPANRDFFVCCEGGEFFNHFEFDQHELIIHTDADMIMQRPMSPFEREKLQELNEGDIAMSGSAKPVPTLREEYFRLRPKRNYLKTNKDFPGRWGNIPLYCTGVIIARAETYRKIGEQYLAGIDGMISNFDHHAAGQWLWSYYAKDFNVIDLGNTFHNASWFIDTDVIDGDWLVHGENGQIILFNHTKFLREYIY